MIHGGRIEPMNKDDQRSLAARNGRNFKAWIVCATALILAAQTASAILGSTVSGIASDADADLAPKQWIGTWATAAQPLLPQSLQTFRNQSLRLIVHTSTGGTKVRIKISNTYGDGPLLIGGAHIARQTAAAEIDPRSDRMLKFQGKSSAIVAAGSMAVSDSVELDVPALSDLAVSFFLPQRTEAKTSHSMAKQTSYVSRNRGLNSRRKIPGGQDHSLLALPDRARCRGFAWRSSHRGVWLVAHGRRRNHSGHKRALA
jgi:hypothetical protein